MNAEAKTLGDYTLIKQVGNGALGSVFLAEHRFMKKQYILKVLPEELASDRAFIQRFEEDVGYLAALEHPNIVKIHTVSFAMGQYFLVTDCVVDEFGETTNLGQYLLARAKRFDEQTLFRLLRQLADALDFAHGKTINKKSIVHRNLKLNNLLVAKGNGGIDLMISDFGLTRIIGPGAVLARCYKAVAESLSITGSLFAPKTSSERYSNPPIDPPKISSLQTSFLQTFAFLAPEQKRAELQATVDIKADVYAFGILAYYLLTGDFPEGIFKLPSKIVETLVWNWDSLICGCLQQNPAERPESLVSAIDAIRQEPKGQIDHPFFESHKEMPSDETNLAQETDTAAQMSQEELPAALERLINEKDAKLQFEAGVSAFTEDSAAAKSIESTSNDDFTIPSNENQQPKPEPVAIAAAPTENETNQLLAQALRPILRSAEIERPRLDLDPASALAVDATVKQYTPERREVKNIQPLLTDMVVIPGGSFYRGSVDGNRDEMPRHRVSVNSFAIDIHHVTNEQFVRFLEVMGGEKDSNHLDIIRLRDSRIKRSAGKLSIESGYSKHPVVGVTWYGAVAYAKWVGKRLPTEAEWEIAARGGDDSFLYPTGDDMEKSQANFFSSDSTAVMSYAPNSYGLYDMAGNVYEWCHDWYGYNYYEVSVQEPDNPKGPLQGVYRVLRGGCWKSLKEDLRCSRRHRNNPGTVNSTYGFRCAADVQ